MQFLWISTCFYWEHKVLDVFISNTESLWCNFISVHVCMCVHAHMQVCTKLDKLYYRQYYVLYNVIWTLPMLAQLLGL